MNICLIDKAELEAYPPVLSVLLILADLKHTVTFLTPRLNPEMQHLLESRGIKCLPLLTFPRSKSIFGKILEYGIFRLRTIKYLKKHQPSSNTLLWIVGAHTALALGRKITNYNYVMQVHELHNESKLFSWSIGRIIHNAKVVFMPEFNRAVIYQCWYKLTKRPVVLPNKPYFVPTHEEMNALAEKHASKLKLLKNKRVVIYQGIIHKERDLSHFAEAIKKLGNDYCLLLVGKDLGMLDHYRKILPEILHIDFLPAPDYLAFTNIADVGIVVYDPLTLNTAYCAPNKIFEYAACGLPMIGNNIPGLEPLRKHGAGTIVDVNNTDDIVQNIQTIIACREKYREGALRLFNDVNNKKIIEQSLAKIMDL